VQADRAHAVASDSCTTWAVAVRCFHAELVLFTGDPVVALLAEQCGSARLATQAAHCRSRLTALASDVPQPGSGGA
jgi:hypothetical protein